MRGDDAGGADLAVAELGVGVEVAAPGDRSATSRITGRCLMRANRAATVGERPGYLLIVAAPALQTISSCEPVPPEQPIAPISLPASTIGMPPREAMMPSSVSW